MKSYRVGGRENDSLLWENMQKFVIVREFWERFSLLVSHEGRSWTVFRSLWKSRFLLRPMREVNIMHRMAVLCTLLHYLLLQISLVPLTFLLLWFIFYSLSPLMFSSLILIYLYLLWILLPFLLSFSWISVFNTFYITV